MKKFYNLLASFILLIGLNSTIVSADNTDGLIGYWSFNEGIDSVTMDKSGNGNNGAIKGGANWVEGKFGTALMFDGNDYVDCGNNEMLEFGLGDFTISAWVKIASKGDFTIFAKGGDNGGGIRYQLAAWNGVTKFVLDDDVAKKDPNGNIQIADSAWHNIVGIRAGNTLRVYVDNVEDAGLTGHARSTLPDNFNIAGTVWNAYIGCIKDNDNKRDLIKFFIGIIDDVAIWDRVLDENERYDLWMEGEGKPVLEPVVEPVVDPVGNRTIRSGVQGFILNKSFPNPFKVSTAINFRMMKESHTNLTVFNSVGNKVAVLIDGVRSAGEYKVQFDGSKLPGGIYFAKLQTGTQSQTIKLLLVK